MLGGLGLRPGPQFYQEKPGADPRIGFRAQHRLVYGGLGTPFSGSAGLRV